jgi:hypothetical protein
LTIPKGTTESGFFDMGENGFRSPVTMLMLAPDVLLEPVNVLVCGPTGRFCKLRSGMTVITLAAECADQAVIMNVCQIMIRSTIPVADDRTVEFVYNHTVLDRV